MLKEIDTVRRDDAASFLPAMLKSKKAELRQSCRLFVAENAKDAAFLVKFVEKVLDHLAFILHPAGSELRTQKSGFFEVFAGIYVQKLAWSVIF